MPRCAGQPIGHRRAGAIALATAGLALGGCGHVETVGRSRAIQVALTEFRLSPRTLRMAPGPITLLVHNFGRLTHNLAVLRRDSTVVQETPPIAPGAGAVLTVDLPPGRYVLASTLFDDRSLGDNGAIVVSR